MIYHLYEGDKYDIKKREDYVDICLPKLECLYTMSSEDIIREMLIDNNIIRLVSRNESIYNDIINYIIKGYDKDELFDMLITNNVPLFSLALNGVEYYRKKYLAIENYKNADIIYIDANTNNIVTALDIASGLSCRAIINGNDISLYKYKLIFDNYDINKINNNMVKIYYQDQNSPITPGELKELANKVYYIVDDLKKSDLSPIEKVMYVYDILKKKEYGRTEDIRDERDVDRVILSNKMVCSGYSNLFNAILNCLDIKSVPIMSDEIKHQRSMAYIKDSKYNLDGVYVFDPTWDRVRECGNGDYNYFALPFLISSKTFPSDCDVIFSLSFDDIIFYARNDITFELVNRLSFLCNIINNDLADEFGLSLANDDDEIRNEYYMYYLSFMANYKVNEIDFATFSKILYNVRRFEYYNDKCAYIDIDEIKDTIVNRFLNIRSRELKDVKNISRERQFLELLKCNADLEDRIDDTFDGYIVSSIKGSDSVERDIENIKLVKLLRKKINS